MSDPGQELVVPGIGQVVRFDDPPEVAAALAAVRDLEGLLREAKSQLTAALVHHATVQGTKTLHLENCDVTIKSGDKVVYDAEEIEAGLRAAGMPEDRIREVVKETVSYSVNAVKAKQAAAANHLYRAVIERHSHLEESPPYATIKR